MKLIKLNIFIGLFLVICFLPLNSAAAEDTNLKIQLNIYEPTNNNGELDYTEDILLSLEIINNNNYWVAIGNNYNSKSYLTLEMKNKDETIHYYDYFANEILIPPSDTTTVLIPFDYYNEMSNKERIDSWSVKPQFNFGGVKYYNTPFEATGTSPNYPLGSSTSSIVGNILSFNTVDSNAELNTENNLGNGIIKTGMDFLSKENRTVLDGLFIAIVAVVAAIIIGRLIKDKR